MRGAPFGLRPCSGRKPLQRMRGITPLRLQLSHLPANQDIAFEIGSADGIADGAHPFEGATVRVSVFIARRRRR